MRVDKLLSELGLATRSECSKAAKRGEILINGRVCRADDKVDPNKDKIFFRGQEVNYSEFIYIMLNKPQGVVSSTDGKDGKTVISLLSEEYQKRGLFPCGRLDKDTVGLMLLTNDGDLSHRMLSPKKHVPKTYYLKTEFDVTDNDCKTLEKGVDIGEERLTKPCTVEKISERELNITISEGVYHQIKRMLNAVGNNVTYLERIKFASLSLDTSLKRGEWRLLTEREINSLKSN